MATEKIEKQAKEVISLSGNDIEWFDELFDRQDPEVQDRIGEIIEAAARDVIEITSDYPVLTEKLIGLQLQVVKLRAQGLLKNPEYQAEHNVLDAAPEKELRNCGPVEEYVPPGVGHPFWGDGDAPEQDKRSVDYLVPTEPDLNELRDQLTKGPRCPEKPLIAAPSADRPIHIVITSGDKTVTIDL